MQRTGEPEDSELPESADHAERRDMVPLLQLMDAVSRVEFYGSGQEIRSRAEQQKNSYLMFILIPAGKSERDQCIGS